MAGIMISARCENFFDAEKGCRPLPRSQLTSYMQVNSIPHSIEQVIAGDCNIQIMCTQSNAARHSALQTSSTQGN